MAEQVTLQEQHWLFMNYRNQEAGKGAEGDGATLGHFSWGALALLGRSIK